jgi:hypothetical protein
LSGFWYINLAILSSLISRLGAKPFALFFKKKYAKEGVYYCIEDMKLNHIGMAWPLK